MTDRPTMSQVFLMFARDISRRSVCRRRVQVGCIITDWSMTNVVALGYNGPARGLAHDCSPNITDDCPTCADPNTACPHKLAVRPGGCTCVHAEANALIKAPYDRGPLRMYTTLSPCANCARLVLNSQVRDVTYIEEYRDREGIDILRYSGVVAEPAVLRDRFDPGTFWDTP